MGSSRLAVFAGMYQRRQLSGNHYDTQTKAYKIELRHAGHITTERESQDESGDSMRKSRGVKPTR